MSAFKTMFSLSSLIILSFAARHVNAAEPFIGPPTQSAASAAADTVQSAAPATNIAAAMSGDDIPDLELLRGIYYGELSLDPNLRVLLTDEDFRPILDSYVTFWIGMCNRTGGVVIVENIVSSDDADASSGSKPYLVQLRKLQAQILSDGNPSSSARGVNVNVTVLETLQDEDDVIMFFEVGRGMVDVAHKLKVIDELARKMLEGGIDTKKEAQDRKSNDDDDSEEFIRALMQKVALLEKENEDLRASLGKGARAEL